MRSIASLAASQLDSNARRPGKFGETHRGVGVLAVSPIHYQIIKSEPKLAKKLSDRVLEIGAGFKPFVQTHLAIPDRVSDSVV